RRSGLWTQLGAIGANGRWRVAARRNAFVRLVETVTRGGPETWRKGGRATRYRRLEESLRPAARIAESGARCIGGPGLRDAPDGRRLSVPCCRGVAAGLAGRAVVR